MKISSFVFLSAATIMSFSLAAKADSIEATLAKKGSAVVCAQSTGVLKVENLHDELNTRIQAVKETVTVSAPTITLGLINVGEKNTVEPGALSVLCVTITKKK